ncbi:hypothetical protein E2C01_000186 [Portunus trituberculatus]|uniref:Uncharacterized protein n=1 Tax=Portunus trituberculatus TaxID=210409 RepID=A0A5B7CDF9_PORTR|nr:hypothetical protein [Portunus trituberculatus]
MNEDGAATSAGAHAHQLARMRVTSSIQSPTTPITPQVSETPNFLPLTHLGDENVMEGKAQGVSGLEVSDSHTDRIARRGPGMDSHVLASAHTSCCRADRGYREKARREISRRYR